MLAGGDRHQLAPEREDGVGVPEHGAAELRQSALSAARMEQLASQALLQLSDLRAQSRLRQRQLLRRARHAAFTRGVPEIKEVVIVEPIHGGAGGRPYL